jgi:hypothetical protein
MKVKSPARSSELQLLLGASRSDLVRSFVREAALAEGAPLACAGLISADSAEAWLLLSEGASGDARAHVALSLVHDEARVRIVLHGHARFAGIMASLGSRMRPGAGVSCHESGIDNWEVSLHRGLNGTAEALFPALAVGAAPEEPPLADDVEISLAEKRDAVSIARCFLDVYGHHYVHADVFSPQKYWARVERGELLPVVARDRRGDVIGHLALERDPGALVAERGEAVVLPAYRGRHLLERMTARLSEEAPGQGLHGVYSEALTIHTFSQRNDERSGMPVCAVLLGANPESFRPRDVACPTAGQRQSYLRTFGFVQPPPPRTLQAAGPYQEVLANIYDSLGVRLTKAQPAAPASADSLTRLRVNDRGYGVIRFIRIGTSCAIELAQALRDVRSLGARSVQLSALANDPGLPQLITAARDLGFFFCGLGPAFADGEDLVLLQLLTEPLETGKLQLYTDVARQLVAFIDADRTAVSRGAGA